MLAFLSFIERAFIPDTAHAAQAPAVITYQGKLLVNSLAATTSQSMILSLYTASSGGSVVYTASGTVGTPVAFAVTPTNGIFTVNLGGTDLNTIDPTVFQNNQSLYLQVTVGGEVLLPRKQITAAPYAFNAKYLDGIAATSTASSSVYIPVSDSVGNFNFNRITSTGILVSGGLNATGITTTNFSSGDTVFGNATSTNLNVSGVTNLGNTTITNVTSSNLFGASGVFTGITSTNFSVLNAAFTNVTTTNLYSQILRVNGTSTFVTATFNGSVMLGSLNSALSLLLIQATSTNGTALQINNSDGISMFKVASTTQTYLTPTGAASTLGGLSTLTVGANGSATGAIAIQDNGGVSIYTTNGLPAGFYGSSYLVLSESGQTGTTTLSNTSFNFNRTTAKPDGVMTFNSEGSASTSGTLHVYSTSTLASTTFMGFVGMATTTPQMRLTLDSDGGILAVGTMNQGAALSYGGTGARLIWYPRKSAFRAGAVINSTWDVDNIGDYSTAFGYNSMASGEFSFAGGNNSNATGESSVALGSGNLASGDVGSVALGINNTARGRWGATAVGQGNTAGGSFGNIALGYLNYATGTQGNIAMGHLSSASGTDGNIAMGYYSIASGTQGSVALGNRAVVNGAGSVALGSNITVNASQSVGIGISSTAFTLSRDNTLAIMGGSVGIGTVTPAHLLTVIATSTSGAAFGVYDSDNNLILSAASSSVTVLEGISYVPTIYTGIGSVLEIGSPTGKSGVLKMNNGVISFVDTNGNVNGQIDSGSFITTNGAITSTYAHVIKLGSSAAALDGSFSVSQSGNVSASGTLRVSGDAVLSARLNVAATSTLTTTTITNLGVGTATPQEKVHVVGGNILQTASANPILKGIFNTSGTANSVYISGRYAYIADASEGLNIIDISDPARPTSTGWYDTTGLANEVVVSGRYAYVADGSSGLQIIDVADPSNPILMGTYDTGSAQGVYISGKYAYVADFTSGFKIVDISNPTNPTLAGEYDTSGFAFKVYVVGRYAYVADSGSGLQIIDVSNSASTTLISTFDTSGAARDVYVSGKYAYVADDSSGLRILDISSSTSPTSIGSYDTTSNAMSVYVSGKYAYVADDADGLHVIDISSSTNPMLVGTYNTTGNAYGVHVSGKYAYVADAAAGLVIVDINGIETPSLYAGNIATNDLTVTENFDVGNNAYIRSGLNVGLGGIYTDGSINSTVTSTTSTIAGYTLFATTTINNRLSIQTSSREFALNIGGDGSIISRGTFGSGDTLSTSNVGTRMIWYARKAAFRAGDAGIVGWDEANVGNYSFAGGSSTTASGSGATAFGTNNDATNGNSFAAGSNNLSSGLASAVFGYGNAVTNSFAFGGGYSNNAGGYASAVFGFDNNVQGDYNFSAGAENYTVGQYATALGNLNNVTNTYAFAAGYSNNSGGSASVAMGYDNNAQGDYSAALGFQNTTVGSYSFSTGVLNNVTGSYSSAFGLANTVGGAGAFAAGYNNYIRGVQSIGLGTDHVTGADYTTALGRAMTITGQGSVGIGLNGSSYTLSAANTMAIMGGNVGIGTTTPQAKFGLDGDMLVTGTSTFLGRLGIGTTTPRDTLSVVGGNLSIENAPGSVSTTLSGTAFKFGKTSSFTNGVFSIDSSGHTAISGTLRVFATSTLATTTISSLTVVGTCTGCGASLTNVNMFTGTTTFSTTTVIVTGLPTYTTSSFATTSFGANVMGIKVVGRYAYLAHAGAGLTIWDVSKPLDPQLVGHLDTAGTAYDLEVVGNYVYLVDFNGGLRVIDVSNRAVPRLVTTLSTADWAQDIVIQGKYAYIAVYLAGFQIVDISNPTSPVSVATIDHGFGDQNSMFVNENLLYTGDGGSTFQVWDVSVPAQARKLSSVNLTGSPPNPRGVYVSGRYAYVGGAARVSIIDVSNPSNIVGVATTTVSDQVQDLIGVGNYLYVAENSSGIRVMDISNVTSSVSYRLYDPPGLSTVSSIAISGRHFYLGNAQFQVFDLRGLDVSHAHISSLETSVLRVNDQAVFGSSLLVNNGLWVGSGGIYSQGSIIAFSSSTTSTGDNFSAAAHFISTSSTVQILNRRLSDGTIVSLRQDNTEEGTISIAANTVTYNAFTGAHYAVLPAGVTSMTKGTLLTLTGLNERLHNIETSEIIYGVSSTAQANDPRVLGSYLSIQNGGDYSVDNPYLVMAVGNGEMWVVDNGYNIEPGDYFISSNIAGHGMKDTGEFDQSYVVARAAQAVDWSAVTTTIEGIKHTSISVFYESFVKDNRFSKTLTVNTASTTITIGNASTSYALRLRDAITFTSTSVITTLATESAGARGFVLNASAFTGSENTTLLSLQTGGETRFAIRGNGDVLTNGIVRAASFETGTSTLDLAETYPIDTSCQADGTCPEAGDAVCLVENKVATIQQCTLAYSEKAIGIISTNPGFTLGGRGTDKERKVALAGRVPLKISTKNGIIRPGDKLATSDIPGVAMKATEAGPTIGIALESYDGSEGTVLAFVRMGWWSPMAVSGPSIDSSGVWTAELIFTSVLEGLKNLGVTIVQGVVKTTEFIAEKVTSQEVNTQKLCVDSTCITKDQFKQLLDKNNITPEATSTPPLNPTPIMMPTDPATTTDSGSETVSSTSPMSGDSTPAATEPAPSEPVSTEPVPAEPVSVEPAPTPVVSEPASVEPATIPAVTEPTPTEPVSAPPPVIVPDAPPSTTA